MPWARRALDGVPPRLRSRPRAPSSASRRTRRPALPGPAGAALLDAGREAFAQAFEATATISAAVALAAAVLAAIMLRRVGTPPAQPSGDAEVTLLG